MASINISDLHPAGSDLFFDSEGYMNDLGDNEFNSIHGGLLPALLLSAAGLAARASSVKCASYAVGAVGASLAAIAGYIDGGR